MVFSEIFWGSVIVTASGLLLKILSMIFKSKCSEFSCWGMVVKRDVVIEERMHEYDIEHHVNTRDPPPSP